MYQYKEIPIVLRKTIEKWTDGLILMRQKNYLIYLTLQFTLLLQAKIFWCVSHCSEGLLWVMSRRRSTKPNSKYLHMLESQRCPSTLSYSVQNSFVVYWVCLRTIYSKNIVSHALQKQHEQVPVMSLNPTHSSCPLTAETNQPKFVFNK